MGEKNDPTPDELAASWAVLNLELVKRQGGFRPSEVGPEHAAARERLMNELMGRYGAIAYDPKMPLPKYERVTALEKKLEAAKSLLWMAKNYAEAGGDGRPEMRDYNAAIAVCGE